MMMMVVVVSENYEACHYAVFSSLTPLSPS
jgi:hypothetical protein